MNPTILTTMSVATALLCLACGDDPADDTSSDSAADATVGDDDGADDGADDDDGDDDDGNDDGQPDDDGNDDGQPDDDGEDTTGMPTQDAGDDGTQQDCTDQMILDLGLVDDMVSDGSAVDQADGDDWVSSVDATAGGIVDAATNAWLYLRFTPDGLRKVEVDDLEALDSSDWDLATKRFGIRLNSGVSGPSSVTAALVTDIAYADLTALPDTAALLEETYYDAQCMLIDDGSGQGAPNYAMTQWWFYPGCVGTTGNPFVIELADEARVKFVVEAYYEEGQQSCNNDGAMGSGSANYTWRWAYLAP